MLLFTRRLLPLFITQFLGAFNDNLFKNALVILITYTIAEQTGENAQILVTIAAGLFILPFFIFSATAGQLADKFDRAKVAQWTKIAEIIIMIFAALAFYIGNSWLLISILFVTGVQAAFFGPVKYAILPQLLSKGELLAGNAYVEAGTFLAILLGTITGGLLVMSTQGIFSVACLLIVIAVIGYIASLYIPKAPPPAPSLKLNHNIWQETFKILLLCAKNKRVLYCVLSISWFWLVGATFLAQFPTYVKSTLHTEAKAVSLFLALFTCGIAIGSFICAKLQHGAIKSTLVPFAAIGMSIFILDLFFASHDQVYNNVHGLLSIQAFIHMQPSMRIMLDILALAIFGGIYIVPLYTIVQYESDSQYRARIIAALNVYNALFMVISAIFALSMLATCCSVPEVFLSLSIVNFLVATMIFKFLKS